MLMLYHENLPSYYIFYIILHNSSLINMSLIIIIKTASFLFQANVQVSILINCFIYISIFTIIIFTYLNVYFKGVKELVKLLEHCVLL